MIQKFLRICKMRKCWPTTVCQVSGCHQQNTDNFNDKPAFNTV